MPRYLAMHDYGMGALYWWVEAPSPELVAREYAEVVVVDDPDPARFTDVPVVVLGDEELPAGLDGLREQRRAQRGRPGFGALVGRGTVWLRVPFEEEDTVYLLELGADGYRRRQVEVPAGGHAVRTTPEDWILNPPEDLWDPELAAREISRDEFEAAWGAARALVADREDVVEPLTFD